jgi:hypothetical protein
MGDNACCGAHAFLTVLATVMNAAGPERAAAA